MDGDLDLLLSLASGLGRWQELDAGGRVYVRDQDALGAPPSCTATSFF
jgi:hypothetical protein